MPSPPAEVQGTHEPQEDEAASTPLLTKVQESLLSYWDSAKTAAQDLYKKTSLTTVDEKIRYHRTQEPGVWPPPPTASRTQEFQPLAPPPSDSGVQVQMYTFSRTRYQPRAPPTPSDLGF